MRDQAYEERILRQAGRNTPVWRQTAEPLGANVETYMKHRLGGLRRNAGVVDVWRQLLPGGLAAHCEIVAIRGGVLEVEVEPGPYMHELRLLSAALLAEVGRYCGGMQLRKLVIRPRRKTTTETEEIR